MGVLRKKRLYKVSSVEYSVFFSNLTKYSINVQSKLKVSVRYPIQQISSL